MDPNAALNKLRSAAQELRTQLDADRNHVNLFKVEEVLEHFEALDEWMARGGFLPASWRRNR